MRFHACSIPTFLRRATVASVAFLILLAGAPSSANASTFVFNNTPGGINILNDTIANFAASYWPILEQDASSYGGLSACPSGDGSCSGSYQDPARYVYPLGEGGNNVPGQSVYGYCGNPNQNVYNLELDTVNRLCSLVEPTAQATQESGCDLNWLGGDQGSNDNSWILMFNDVVNNYNNVWVNLASDNTGFPGEGGTNGGPVVGGFACTSWALPAQTLSLSVNSITLGQPVTLTWNDTVPLDYYSATDTAGPIGPGESDGNDGYPDPALVAGATPISGWQPSGINECGMLSSTNAGDPPNAVCTASYTTPDGNADGAAWTTQEASSNGGWDPPIRYVEHCGTNGELFTDYETYNWDRSAAPTVAEVKSGSAQFTPTVAGQYVYTYKCTNTNGTTVKTATLTVGTNDSNLTTGPVTLNPAGNPTQGTPINLQGTVTNSGPAAANGQSTDLYEIYEGSSPPTQFSQDTATILDPENVTLSAGSYNNDSKSYTFNSTGTWWVRLCANTSQTNGTPPNGVTNESNYTDNCSATSGNPIWTQVTVQPPSNDSNLTTGPVTLNPAGNPTQGTPINLQGTVTNSGPAAANGQSTDLYEIYEGSSPPTQFSQDTATILDPENVTLSAGSYNNDSKSYTFNSTGTWWVRLCANTSQTNGTPPNGVTNEWNYLDNCSSGGNNGWTEVTVQAPPPSVSCSISTPNNCVWVGQTCTLTNAQGNNPGVTYAASTLNGATAPYDWLPSTAPPNMTCTNTGSTPQSSDTCTFSAGNGAIYNMQVGASGVSVNQNCPPVTVGINCGTPEPTITASPSRVVVGQKTQISWSATGVETSCTVTGPNFNPQVNPPVSCTVAPPNPSAEATVEQPSTYCITCDGDTNTEACASVNLVPLYYDF